MATSEWFTREIAIAQHRRDIEEAGEEFEEGLNLQTYAQKGMTPKEYMRHVAKKHSVSVAELKQELYYEPTDEDWEEHDAMYTIVIRTQDETP